VIKNSELWEQELLRSFRISSSRSWRHTHGFGITYAHVNLEHYTERETGRQRGVRRVKGSQTIGSRGVGARSVHRWFVDGGSTRAATVGEERRRSGDGDAVQWRRRSQWSFPSLAARPLRLV
jgi:hypothetical protein